MKPGSSSLPLIGLSFLLSACGTTPHRPSAEKFDEITRCGYSSRGNDLQRDCVERYRDPVTLVGLLNEVRLHSDGRIFVTVDVSTGGSFGTLREIFCHLNLQDPQAAVLKMINRREVVRVTGTAREVSDASGITQLRFLTLDACSFAKAAQTP